VVEVLDGWLYKVEYTDDGGVVQTATCDASKLGPAESGDKSDEDGDEDEGSDEK
jgi:hypothetical protein